MTNNRLQYLGQSLSKLNKLKSLDLSNNLLTEHQRPDHFQTLPMSLETLVLTHNPWTCVPALTWVYHLALDRPHLHPDLRQIQCRIKDSYQRALLIGNYSSNVQFVSKVSYTYACNNDVLVVIKRGTI